MIKAVVFDAYGTLFDVYSIQALAETLYPGMGADIAVKWRDKQIEYTRLITQSDPHNPSGSRYFRPFWELTRLSLEYTLDRLKLDRASGQTDQLMQQYAHLTAFPENLTVLEEIKAMGLTTAILSNGSMDMLLSAVNSAGMGDVLDHIISVDAVRLFKTSLGHRTMPAGRVCRLKWPGLNPHRAISGRGFVAQVHRGRDHEVPAQKGGQAEPENRLQFVRVAHAASFRIGSGGARARQ
jgi:2-haloalkanoic acid dehalogenase type II